MEKKRGLLNLMPGLKENELFELISRDKSIEKYLDNQKIKGKFILRINFSIL